VLVVAIIRELTSIGASDEIVEACNKIQESNPDNWKFTLSIIIEFIFAKGSWLTVLCLFLLIVLIAALKLFETKYGHLLNSSVPEIELFIKAQANQLDVLQVETSTTQGKMVLNRNTYKGKASFSHYYNFLKTDFKKFQSYDKVKPKEEVKKECQDFFQPDNEVTGYIEYLRSMIMLFKKYKSHQAIEGYVNQFKANLNYYEKLLMFYFIYGRDDSDFLKECNRHKLFDGINRTDLIHEETFNLILND